jgi:hypothetical protein
LYARHKLRMHSAPNRVHMHVNSASGGSYESIPLEVNAYTLGGRFEANPAQQFSVAEEVRRWVVVGKF